MENKQNALTEVNIPIDNGIMNDTKSMEVDFPEVDINGNTSFITSVRSRFFNIMKMSS